MKFFGVILLTLCAVFAHVFAATPLPKDVEDCVKTCIIPYILKPVCGSDGHTFMNKELFDCAKNDCHYDVELVKEGEC